MFGYVAVCKLIASAMAFTNSLWMGGRDKKESNRGCPTHWVGEWPGRVKKKKTACIATRHGLPCLLHTARRANVQIIRVDLDFGKANAKLQKTKSLAYQ